jgi:hypothetical protein
MSKKASHDKRLSMLGKHCPGPAQRPPSCPRQLWTTMRTVRVQVDIRLLNQWLAAGVHFSLTSPPAKKLLVFNNKSNERISKN